jgi:hypothetical protein
LICTDCDAYKATQSEGTEALERMAKEASEQFGTEMAVAGAMCDGCRATTGRQIGYRHQCAIRLCAVPKHIETCAHCDEYACEKVDGFVEPGSAHRETLDDVWSSLRSTR